MSAEINDQVARLVKRCSEFSALHGAQIVAEFQNKSVLLIQWLSYLGSSQKTGVANELLDGAFSSAREAAACLSLGLVRPGLFAVRTQIDLVLAWLYFKDHPVEWKTVNDCGEGYKLKREILEYLSEHYKGFATRFAALKDVATRSAEDPYRLLSAHIHAQSQPALPAAINLVDVVHDQVVCEECTVLAGEVCEYLSDLLTSAYGVQWMALPKDVRASIETRLAVKRPAKEKFFTTL